MRKRFSRFLLPVLLLCVYGDAQVGVIKGFVVDETGKPISRADVTWLRVARDGQVEVQVGVVPRSRTNNQGHFIIRALALGDPYKIYAQKEDAFYPDMTFGLYNPKDDATIVTATTEDKASDVTIHPGPKAGQLALDVRDAATGMPVNPTISVKRTQTGEGFGGGDQANARFLIPANTDVSFTASAPGYETWYYPGTTDEKQSTPLRVKPKEQKLLEIQLERKR